MSKFVFAYDNGVELMKEINADIRTVGEISKWPLGLLIAIVAALVSVLFGDSAIFVEINNLAVALLFTCSITILFILLTITIPSLAIHAHNQPKNLMTGSADSIIKREIERLQSGIDINMLRLKNLKKRLIGSIIFIFLVLGSSFTWFLIQV